MVYYLFDTSALIERYFNHYKAVLDPMYLQKISKEAFFYFPNMCVVEVFNTFAKKFYRRKEIKAGEYKNLCDTFKGHIRNGKLLYPYNLYRYHNQNADLIYETEHTLEPLNPESSRPRIAYGKCWLSSVDILIIAMGMELQKIHGKNVYIVTNDERLAAVSNAKPDLFAPAIYLRTATTQSLPHP